MNKKTVVVVAAAAGAIVISGGAALALATSGDPLSAGAQPTSSPFTTSTSTTGPTTNPTTGPTAAPGELTPEDAARIARERLGGGTVYEIEREHEHGRAEWEVELSKDGVAYEVRVDARTGDITRIEQDDRRGGDRDDDRSGHGGGDHHGDDHDDDHDDDDDKGGDR